MGKGITHPLDADRALEPEEISRLRNRIDASPLANEFQQMNIPLEEEPAEFRQFGLGRTQLSAWQGRDTTDAERTIIGLEIKGRSVIGRRLKEDFERIIKKNAALNSPHKVASELYASNAKKAFDDRATLFVTRADKGLAAKFEKMFEQREIDMKVMNRLADAIAEVLEDMQRAAIQSGYYNPFTTVEPWSSQVKDANSGHPYYAPTSKQEMMETYWPRFSSYIFNIVNNHSPTTEEEFLTPAIDNAHLPISTLFTRTPNRLIQAARLLSKLMGYNLNHNLLRMLSELIRCSWHGLDVTFERGADSFSNANSVIYDDFDAYDLTFSKLLMELILERYRESDFLSHAPDLRKALDYLIYEVARDGNRLRVSPLHTIICPVVLPSGSPITQWLGILVHLAVYKVKEQDSPLGVTGYEVLSDDGYIAVEAGYDEAKRYVEGEWADFVSGMGMALNVDKSYVADLDTRIYLGEMYGNEMYDHDHAAYLQKAIFDTPILSRGIIERIIRSLQGTERDTSEKAMKDLLKQHITAARSVKSGDDIQKAYYDIHRMISVLASLQPGHPLCDDLLVAVAKGFPNFEKRWVKFRDRVDEKLFDEDVLFAGGTLKSGLTPKWVADYFDELVGGGDPTIWTTTRLD